MAPAPKWILIIVIAVVAIATIWYLVQQPKAEKTVSSTVSSSSDPLGSSFEVTQEVESAVEPNAFRNVQTNPFSEGSGG